MSCCDGVAAPLVHPGHENWPCAPQPAAAAPSARARQQLLSSQAALGPHSGLQPLACNMPPRKRPASGPELSGGCKRQHVAPPALPLRRSEEAQLRQQRLQGLLDLFEGLPLPPSPAAVERRITIEHEATASVPAPGSAGAVPPAEPAAAAAAAWVQPAGGSPTSSHADTQASRSPSPQPAAQQADAASKLQLLACVASMEQGSPTTQQAVAAAPPAPTTAVASPPASSRSSPAPPAAGPPAAGSPRPPLPPQLRPHLRQLKRLLAMLGAVQAAAAQPEWRAAAARQPATAAVLHRLRQLSRAQQLPLCSVDTLRGLLAQFCGCA